MFKLKKLLCLKALASCSFFFFSIFNFDLSFLESVSKRNRPYYWQQNTVRDVNSFEEHSGKSCSLYLLRLKFVKDSLFFAE